MKLIYGKNPVDNHFELDEYDKILIKKTLYLNEVFDMAWDIRFAHEDSSDIKGVMNNLIKLLDKSDDDNFLDDYDKDLKALSCGHDGDCTCFAATCSQCYIEGILGINSIKRWTSYSLLYASSAVNKFDDLDKAIEYLENYKCDRITDTNKQFADKWEKDHHLAAKLLSNHKELYESQQNETKNYFLNH
jgi:hypothetical protein